MEVYIGLAFWSIFSGLVLKTPLQSNTKKIFYLILNFIPFVFFAGLRGCGADTLTYSGLIESILNGYSEISFDIGFFKLIQLIGLIYNDTTFVFIVLSMITYFCYFYYFYNQSKNVFISVYLFITLYFYCTSFNIMRQMLAMSVVLIALVLLNNKKRKKAIIVYLCAILIHISSIIFIPLFYIKKIEEDLNLKKYYMVVTLMIIILALFPLFSNNFLALFPRYEEIYLSSTFNESRGMTASIIIPIAILIWTIFSTHIYKRHNDSRILFHNISLLISAILLVESFLIFGISRLVIYFQFFLCVAIPYALSYTKPLTQYICYFGIVIVTFIYFYMMLFLNQGGVVPYVFAPSIGMESFF